MWLEWLSPLFILANSTIPTEGAYFQESSEEADYF